MSEKDKNDKKIAVQQNLNFVTPCILCQSTAELEKQKVNFLNGYIVFDTDAMKLMMFYNGEFIKL